MLGGCGSSSEHASIQNKINAENGTNPWSGEKGSKMSRERQQKKLKMELTIGLDHKAILEC